MVRKLSESIKDRFENVDLKLLLEHLKDDSQLRLEIRKTNASIYYRKGLALKITANKLDIDPKYSYRRAKGKDGIIKTDVAMPNTELAKQTPRLYFTEIERIIDDWCLSNKHRNEFDTQQIVTKGGR